MQAAAKNPIFVKIMNLKGAVITGSDGKTIDLRNHNKMLWRKPGVIGKTGYTFKARHCYAGLDFSAAPAVAFAILSSRKPWEDIKRLLNFKASLTE
jgi:D-alanyl-D-alanine carboxypeptidase